MRRLVLVLSALGSLTFAGGHAQAHAVITDPAAVQPDLVVVQWGGPGPYDDRGGWRRDEERHEEWRAREEERRREEWHHRRWLCEHRGICG